jgi:mannose/fructose-specific phosphotransferase system component IIA
MAEGLVDAVARISGFGREVLRPLSNDGKSPEALQAELSELLASGPTVVFADLPSGSCAVTARLCCLKEEETAVIFGVNLPILLDFVFHRHLPLPELVPRLLERGRGSLSSHPDY